MALSMLVETYLRVQGSHFPVSVEKMRRSSWCFGSLTQPATLVGQRLRKASPLLLRGAGTSQVASLCSGPKGRDTVARWHPGWAGSFWPCPPAKKPEKKLSLPC